MHYQVTTQIQILVLGSNQRFGSIQVSWQCLETYEFGGLIQGVANHSVTTSLDKTPPTVTCQATPKHALAAERQLGVGNSDRLGNRLWFRAERVQACVDHQQRRRHCG
jgi:hypothetical protein